MDAKTIGEKWQAYAGTLQEEILALKARIKAYELKEGEWEALRARLEKDLEVCREVSAHDLERAKAIIEDLKASLAEANQRIVEFQQPPLPPVVVDPPVGWPTIEELPALAGMGLAELKQRARSLAPAPLLALSWDRDLIDGGQQDMTFQGIRWTSPDRECLNVARGGASVDLATRRPRKLVIEDCTFGAGEKRNQPQLWHIRAYALESAAIRRTRFSGEAELVGDRMSMRPEQHAAYLSAQHDTLFEDCSFDSLGGHAVHVVQRYNDYQQYKPDTHFPERPMHHVVRRASIVDTDMSPGWGAAALHYTDPGTALHQCQMLFEDVFMVQAWPGWRGDGSSRWGLAPDESMWSPRNCEAFVTITPFQLYERAAVDGLRRHMASLVTFRRFVMARGQNTAKSMGYIRGVRDLVFENGVVMGSGNTIWDIDDNTPEWACVERIRLVNVHAPGVFLRIHRGGKSSMMSMHCPGEVRTYVAPGLEGL